jgi:hypothetical protein
MLLLAFVLFLAAAGFGLRLRRRGRRSALSGLGARRFGRFAIWAVAGLLATSAMLSLFTVGLLILPFALAAVFYAASRIGIGVEALGSAFGAGLLLIAVGLALRDTRPCPMGPVTLLPGQHQTAACGGPTTEPWLLIGVVLAVATVGATAWLWRRGHSSAPAQ